MKICSKMLSIHRFSMACSGSSLWCFWQVSNRNYRSEQQEQCRKAIRLEVVRCFTLGLDQECLFNASGLATFPFEESSPQHRAQPIPQAAAPHAITTYTLRSPHWTTHHRENFASSLENAQYNTLRMTNNASINFQCSKWALCGQAQQA